MPRVLSPLFVVEKNALASDHVITMAFELTMPLAPVPYRVINYDQEVIFHGLSFPPFPIQVDSLEDATSASLVHLRITGANVDQAIQSLLENYWASDPPWTIRVWQLDVMQPDVTPFDTSDVFSVMNVVTDMMVATFDVIAEGLTLTILAPRRRYTTSSGFTNLPRR
jgi:hypothetical protein